MESVANISCQYVNHILPTLSIFEQQPRPHPKNLQHSLTTQLKNTSENVPANAGKNCGVSRSAGERRVAAALLISPQVVIHPARFQSSTPPSDGSGGQLARRRIRVANIEADRSREIRPGAFARRERAFKVGASRALCSRQRPACLSCGDFFRDDRGVFNFRGAASGKARRRARSRRPAQRLAIGDFVLRGKGLFFGNGSNESCSVSVE